MAERPYKACGQPVVRGTGRQVEDKGLGRCGYPRAVGKTKCKWHFLLKQPAEVQGRAAEYRREQHRLGTEDFRDRVPKVEWPDGERWCSGCQSFVPLFYASGSRCKACASTANHRAMVAKVYGLEDGEYEALLRMQGGRCYICGRKSPSRRLAVDHDHETGEVRGLLCPDPERGCNHKVVGPLEANSVDGGLAAAKRLVAYLEDPPYARLRRGDVRPLSLATTAQEPSSGTEPQPPPF